MACWSASLAVSPTPGTPATSSTSTPSPIRCSAKGTWRGDINGRIPLLRHRRALIITSTIFDENAYDDGIRDAIAKVIDHWGFRYPGIDDVERGYFHAATAAPPETIHAYLDRAYQLGKDFGLPRESRSSSTTSGTGGVVRPLAIVWQRLVSGGQTCDRCAATQHEVEHAVHVLA